jgi:hypothetical protein
VSDWSDEETDEPLLAGDLEFLSRCQHCARARRDLYQRPRLLLAGIRLGQACTVLIGGHAVRTPAAEAGNRALATVSHPLQWDRSDKVALADLHPAAAKWRRRR